jgi:hypothetical protein
VAGAVVYAPTISLICETVARIVITYVAEIVFALPDSQLQAFLYILMSGRVIFPIDRDRAAIQVTKTIVIKASTRYFEKTKICEDGNYRNGRVTDKHYVCCGG